MESNVRNPPPLGSSMESKMTNSTKSEPSSPIRKDKFRQFTRSISSFLPSKKSRSGSSASKKTLSLFSTSIPSIFPPNKSPTSGSSATKTRRFSLSIWSIFRPSKSEYGSSKSNETLSQVSYSIQSIFPPNKSETNSSFSAHKNSYSRSIQSYFPAYKSSSEISSTKSKSLTSKESSFSYEVSPAIATNTRPPTPPLPPLSKDSYSIFSIFPPERSVANSLDTDGANSYSQSHFHIYKSNSQTRTGTSYSQASEESSFSYEIPPITTITAAATINISPPRPPVTPLAPLPPPSPLLQFSYSNSIKSSVRVNISNSQTSEESFSCDLTAATTSETSDESFSYDSTATTSTTGTASSMSPPKLFYSPLSIFSPNLSVANSLHTIHGNFPSNVLNPHIRSRKSNIRRSNKDSSLSFEYSASTLPPPPMDWYISVPWPESCASASTHDQSSTKRNKTRKTEFIRMPTLVQKALDSTPKSMDDNNFQPGESSDLTTHPNMALMQSQSSRELLNQETMQHHLQTLIEGAHENWTYAILWESLYDYSGSLILGWSNGYYRGNNNSNDKAKTTTVVVEQELRKKALGKLYSVICGGSDMSNGDDEIVLEDDVPNIEWFFNSSMFYSSIVRGGDLPSHAFFNSSPIWVVGSDQLAGLPCGRARQGQSLGLQTMVCIPWANGVVELGSTDAIFNCEDQMDLIKKVRVLFNSNSLQMSSLPITERGKSDHILRSVLETTNNLHAKDADNISNIIARSGKRTL
ncbi:cell wall protein RBR3-like isoform X1 [Quercus suber]|uniref:cell wall protein RBR3-like isoform X1 n=1 Tax=Quercus suber TaxID=58331 RepID=UPI0032DEE489